MGEIGQRVGSDATQLGPIFAEVARRESMCSSKAQGGDLGLFGPGKMVPEFDAVVFAGSLQFFPDVSEVLRACDAVLAPGGLVVISHVRGNDFIREEKRGNPALIHDMPTADDLANVAGFDLAHVGDALDDFYLAVLQNRR